MDAATITTIAAAVLGSQALVKFIEGLFSKNKTSADAAQVLVTSTIDWASKLTSRIELLEKALKERDDKITELNQRIAHLESCKVDKPEEC